MLIERSGDGPGFILLHGWAMNRHCWHYLSSVLEKVYTAIRVDLPGHHEGCGSSFSFTREDELITELSNLTEEGATWMGWSLGGLLAQRVAQAYPHKVKRLICIGSAACYLQKEAWAQGISEKDFNNYLKVFNADDSMAIEHFLGLQVAGTERAKETLKALKIFVSRNYETKELAAALELLRKQDMREAIPHYNCPALFMGGGADSLISKENIKASAALAPQGEAYIVSGAGHAPMISHLDGFTTGLVDYLKRTDAYI